MIPKEFSHRLYFDFDEKLPLARWNLLEAEDQWTSYLPFTSKYKLNQIIQPQIRYQVELSFLLPTSSQNMNTAKFMCHLFIQDISEKHLAKSSRPVIIPYQSLVTRSLFSILEFPFRMLGVLKPIEAKHVTLVMMNNFYTTAVLPVHSIIVNLNSRDVTIQEVYISFIPKLHGIKYVIIQVNDIISPVLGFGSPGTLGLPFRLFSF